jgi:hypothetical protein
MQQNGFSQFNMSWHTRLWQEQDARNPGKGYGVWVEKQWFWYKRWVDVVEQHCKDNVEKYS